MKMQKLSDYANSRGGFENLRFKLFERPVRTGPFGFFPHTDSSDPLYENMFEVDVDNERYPVVSGYKVAFKPIEINGMIFAPKAYYQSDLMSMIRSGSVEVFMKLTNFIDN